MLVLMLTHIYYAVASDPTIHEIKCTGLAYRCPLFATEGILFLQQKGFLSCYHRLQQKGLLSCYHRLQNFQPLLCTGYSTVGFNETGLSYIFSISESRFERRPKMELQVGRIREIKGVEL